MRHITSKSSVLLAALAITACSPDTEPEPDEGGVVVIDEPDVSVDASSDAGVDPVDMGADVGEEPEPREYFTFEFPTARAEDNIVPDPDFTMLHGDLSPGRWVGFTFLPNDRLGEGVLMRKSIPEAPETPFSGTLYMSVDTQPAGFTGKIATGVVFLPTLENEVFIWIGRKKDEFTGTDEEWPNVELSGFGPHLEEPRDLWTYLNKHDEIVERGDYVWRRYSGLVIGITGQSTLSIYDTGPTTARAGLYVNSPYIREYVQRPNALTTTRATPILSGERPFRPLPRATGGEPEL